MAGRFSFTIDAAINNIPVVAEGIEDYLTDVGTDPFILPDIQLAVDEAVTNIIMHGYKGQPGTIGILCSVDAGTVRIEIRDQAPAFNPLTVPAPDVTADLVDRVVGGMGIYLIRKVMDAVSYEFVDGENVLRMEKKGSG
jgi:serine/threonine-protein kinase RsbW